MSHNQKESESKAWNYFEHVENSKAAKCKGCSTSELLRHLRTVHSELLTTRNAVEEPPLKKRNIQLKMT